MPQTLKLAVGSLLVGITVLALKYLAFLLTGSVALYSDALESVVNLATAGAALVAVRVSAKPADTDHPYGHSKAEYLAAVLEGVLIIVAALSIFREAYFGFIRPQPFDAPLQGLVVSGGATIINGIWSWVLVRRGRTLRSPALIADGQHLLADVLTSAGVLAGLGAAVITGWSVLDPALAALVALNVLWTGWRIMKESVGGLMDEAIPAELLQRLKRLISEQAGGALEAHDLRTRHAGRITFIDFHLVVASTMTVSEAHAICDRLEEAIRAEIPDSRTIIHVEPESKAKHSGVVVI